MQKKIIVCLFLLGVVGHVHAMQNKGKPSSKLKRYTGIPRLSLGSVVSQKKLKRMNELGVSPRGCAHQQVARILAAPNLHPDLIFNDYKKALSFKRTPPMSRKSPLNYTESRLVKEVKTRS